MRLNKYYFDDAMRILAQRRERNERLEQHRLAEIHEKLPEYGRIEKKLADNMSAALNGIYDGKKSDISGLKEAMEENIVILKDMNALLKENGYPADYLDPIYSCPKCKDKGNTGNEWCECLCRLTNELAAAKLNEDAPLDRCTFDSFKLSFYSDETDSESGVSARFIMESNLAACKKFAEEFDGTGKGILMMGNTGLGKTHLSLGIANVIIPRGFCVLYSTVNELIRKINREQFDEAEGDTLSLAKDCDLLILDDLGVEKVTEWSASLLYEIVNTRQNRRVPIIASTNLDFDELREKYHDRISSRLFAMQQMFFEGNDNRVDLSENFTE